MKITTNNFRLLLKKSTIFFLSLIIFIASFPGYLNAASPSAVIDEVSSKIYTDGLFTDCDIEGSIRFHIVNATVPPGSYPKIELGLTQAQMKPDFGQSDNSSSFSNAYEWNWACLKPSTQYFYKISLNDVPLTSVLSFTTVAGSGGSSGNAKITLINSWNPKCTSVELDALVGEGKYTSPFIVKYGKSLSNMSSQMSVVVNGPNFTADADGLKADGSQYQYVITDSSPEQTTFLSGNFFAAMPSGECDPSKTGNTDGSTGTGTGTTTTGGGTTTNGDGSTLGNPLDMANAVTRVVPQDTYADVYISDPLYSETSMTVKYGTSATALTKNITAINNGTQFFGGITGLTAKTTYYYQAVSSDGTKKLSTVFSFKTNESVAGSSLSRGTVVLFSISSVTQTEAVISGKVAVTTSQIQLLVDKTGNGTFDFNTTPKINADKTFSFKVTGLKAGNVYHAVPVKPGNSLIRYWNVQPFATLSVHVVPYVSAISDKTATISAQISTGADNPTLYWGKDINSMTNKVTMRVSDTTSPGLYNAPISGLTPDTGYSYVIGSSDGKTFYMVPATLLTTPTNTVVPMTVPTIVGNTSVSAAPVYDLKALVQCGLDGPLVNGKQACGFPELIALIQRVMDFLLFFLAPIIATVIILYQGVMILTAGSSSEKLTEAKTSITKVIVGFCLAAGAWIIVKFVMVSLGVDTTVFPVFY